MTATFTTFVMACMFNALGCRSSTRSIFTLGLFTNRALALATLVTVVLQFTLVTVPWFHSILQTSSLYLSDALFVTVAASLVLWIEELRKLVFKTGHQLEGDNEPDLLEKKEASAKKASPKKTNHSAKQGSKSHTQ